MNYKNCEKALTRLAIPYMAKIDYQDIYHECNEGEYFIDEDVNLLFSLIKEAEQLSTTLDKACDLLEKSNIGTICDEENRKNCIENHCFNTCIHERNMNKEEWRKYLMKGGKA